MQALARGGGVTPRAAVQLRSPSPRAFACTFAALAALLILASPAPAAGVPTLY